jgi:hypothetical protein
LPARADCVVVQVHLQAEGHLKKAQDFLEAAQTDFDFSLRSDRSR